MFFLFLEIVCIAINFPLRTAFGASHRFWIVMFLLSFVSKNLFISLFISSVLSSLLRNVLFNLHVFFFFFFFSSVPVIDIWFLRIVVRENAWYYFNFLKFIEAWFVTQDLVSPGECSLHTWEESVFFCMWIESREDIS